QHINNMIQLDKNPQREELLAQYGYKDTDLITKDQVRFYQFDVKEHKTEVRALEYGEYGFIAPTFNDMLENLLRQSREFEIEE
ncbi:MAG: ATP-binding protein, partial [Niameybacter sp.]